MKKIFTTSLPFLIILAVAGLFFSLSRVNSPDKNPSDYKETSTTPTLKIRDVTLNLEVANTPAKKSLGLGKRDSINKNSGMLFDFTQDPDARPSFWMKDMRFNIDFLWIKNSKVIQLDKNFPAPKNSFDELPTISPSSPIDYVLEVNSGFIEEHKIEVGDSVQINF